MHSTELGAHRPPPAGGARPPGERLPGEIVRAARKAAGWTLAELGNRCGYSASSVSRLERGRQPLRDITLLGQLAAVLQIPPEVLGLADGSGRHTPVPGSFSPSGGGPAATVGCNLGLGDDDVHRRQLLTGIAGLAAGAALGPPGPSPRGPAPAPPNVAVNLTAGLEPLLCGLAPASAGPVPLARLQSAVAAAHTDFAAARYERLSAGVPALIGTALAAQAGAGAQAAGALLAQSYLVAARLAVKVGDDGLARTLADRAVQAAAGTGDLLALADARRQVAIVLRRHGHPATARRVLLAAADAVEPTGRAGVEQWSAWGTLLATAAYTAAVDGDRDTAHTLIGESAAAARRLGQDITRQGILFGPTNIAVYQIGIAEALGDAGTAIAHARTIRPQDLPTPERRGRYWIDVARAYHQWGKHPLCYRALLAAEQAAPADVRYRPKVHRMVADILRTDHPRTLPGLGAFAHRIGLPS